jgi:cytochrome d ubiquinol oxidase subunit II
MLAEVWYVLLAGMLAVYVMLDGFDLGAGMLHLFVAKTDAERKVVLRSIGPVWDGNEVWLLATGGTMVLAFPVLYARAFSGFYLPLMIVLWFLVFRALGIELRHHVDHPLWRQFWDAAFGLSSLLLTIFFGAALGNVVRGVAMNDAGVFFAPLWTNFRIDPEPGVLDWYTLIVALNATVALAMHGAAWIGWRTTGEVQRRCAALLSPIWTATLVLTAGTTVTTYFVQPQMGHNLQSTLGWWLAPGLALAGFVGLRLFAKRDQWRAAFFSSCAFLVGMLGSAAAAIFPFVLPARDATRGLTIAQAATEPYGLQVALYWWVPGMLLAIAYFAFNYRNLPKRLSVTDPDVH